MFYSAETGFHDLLEQISHESVRFSFFSSCFLRDAVGCAWWTMSLCPSQACAMLLIWLNLMYHWDLMSCLTLSLVPCCPLSTGKSSQLTSHSLPALFENRRNMQRRQGHLAINAHRLSTKIRFVESNAQFLCECSRHTGFKRTTFWSFKLHASFSWSDFTIM